MINWKLRLKNKTTLISLVTLVVSFIYQTLAIFEVIPPIGQEQVLQVLNVVITLLAALGVVVDPTTAGVADSSRALGYVEPVKDGKK